MPPKSLPPSTSNGFKMGCYLNKGEKLDENSKDLDFTGNNSNSTIHMDINIFIEVSSGLMLIILQ